MKLIILIVILIVIILIISFLYNVNKFEYVNMFEDVNSNIIELSKRLQNDKWKNYRIGDVYHQSGKFYDKNFHENILYHENDYPESIASEYIKRNKPYKNRNKSLVKEIIKTKSRYYLTSNLNKNDLVLHIRIGDVICDNYGDNMVSWNSFVNYKTYYSKIGNESWWNEVLQYIKKHNIKTVFILAGSHTNNCLIDSARYIENRKIFLENNGIEVVYRLGQSPDEDLIFVSKSKHFISTGGGYGELLNEMKKNKDQLNTENLTDNVENTHFYVINLFDERGVERRAHIKKIFNDANVNYILHPGYDKNTIDISRINKDPKYNKFSEKLSKEIIALTMTHNDLYKKLLNSDEQFMLIAEDDCTFRPNFKYYLNIVLNNLPSDFDVIRLEYIKKFSPDGKYNNKDNEEAPNDYLTELCYNKDLYPGTACYIISRNGAEYMLKLNEPIWLPPDGIFDPKWQKLKNMDRLANIYYVTPQLAWQGDVKRLINFSH